MQLYYIFCHYYRLTWRDGFLEHLNQLCHFDMAVYSSAGWRSREREDLCVVRSARRGVDAAGRSESGVWWIEMNVEPHGIEQPDGWDRWLNVYTLCGKRNRSREKLMMTICR